MALQLIIAICHQTIDDIFDYQLLNLQWSFFYWRRQNGSTVQNRYSQFSCNLIGHLPLILFIADVVIDDVEKEFQFLVTAPDYFGEESQNFAGRVDVFIEVESILVEEKGFKFALDVI